MQLIIVTLLIGVSSAYLLFKWLPKKQKQYLRTWLIKKAPQLDGVLNMTNNKCSDGCSSCGGCEQPMEKINTIEKMKIIRIFPNSSSLN